jgi:uncharacterized protein (TIGR03435 family)
MRYVVCVAIALICTTLPAQTPPATSQFEVASVKPAANNGTSDRLAQILREAGRSHRQPGMIPMTGPDRIRLQNWALVDLIAAAYSVRATQVSGPDWLSTQGFDIEAKLPDGARKEDLNAMLQSLLEDRFGLKAHRGPQTSQGFALIVAKDGPRLKPAQPPPALDPGLTDAERQAQLQQKMLASLARMKERTQDQIASGNPPEQFNSESWDAITTEELAAQLVRFAGAPVEDETGLTGEYSVTIKTSSNPDVPGGTIFDAVEKLGLKLESRKVTVDTVVVDQVSKTPTAN